MFAIETRAEAPAAGSTAKPAVSWGRLTPRHAIRDEVLRYVDPLAARLLAGGSSELAEWLLSHLCPLRLPAWPQIGKAPK